MEHIYYRTVDAKTERPKTCSEFSEHITDLGTITMWLLGTGQWYWYKDRKSHEKLNPTWFLEKVPYPQHPVIDREKAIKCLVAVEGKEGNTDHRIIDKEFRAKIVDCLIESGIFKSGSTITEMTD